MNRDFTYCKGERCAIKEHCTRYLNGLKIDPKANGWWWMNDCGEYRHGYISNEK